MHASQTNMNSFLAVYINQSEISYVYYTLRQVTIWTCKIIYSSDQLKFITYSFAVMQSEVWNNVLRAPSLIVLPMCVLEPLIFSQIKKTSNECGKHLSQLINIVKYLWHKNYNRIGCLSIKFRTVCCFQTQDLKYIERNADIVKYICTKYN